MLISEKGTKEDLLVLFNILGWQRLIGRTNTFNHTALFIACLHGNTMVAEALIEARAGDLQQEVINFRYNGYYTILMLAIENRSTKGVQYLLTIPQIKKKLMRKIHYSVKLL